MRRLAIVTALLAALAAVTPDLTAQRHPASAGLMVGLAPERDIAASVRLELRGPGLGPLAPTASIGRWYRHDGCDAIVGAVCDGGAWVGELGLSVYLARPTRGVVPYTTVSLGKLYPDGDGEGESWHPAIAAGVILRAQQVIGLVAEVKYSHSTAGDPIWVASFDKAGRLWFQSGVRLVF